MNEKTDRRIAWCWALGGFSLALALAVIAATQAHMMVFAGIVDARRSFDDTELLPYSLSVSMRGIWIAGLLAIGTGGAGYFVGPRGSKARWLALGAFAMACLALWLRYDYREYLRWS